MADNAELSANGVSGDSTVTLPVHQEELRIGTGTVDTGRGVRIRKSVTHDRTRSTRHCSMAKWS